MRRSRPLWPARLGRLLRGRLPDRNPLRRRTDRLEAAIFAVLIVVVIATAPFAAWAASGWEHKVSQRELRTQEATFHHVRAILLEDGQDAGAYPALIAEASVEWKAPRGRTVTEVMRVPSGAKTGSVIWIWTNPSGQRVTPLRRTDIPVRDGLAAAAAVAGLVAAAVLAGLAVNRTLNRRHLTAWGVDWMVTEPRWNSRR